eukprot:1277874-Pleurochrysis_carterae.AAC.2
MPSGRPIGPRTGAKPDGRTSLQRVRARCVVEAQRGPGRTPLAMAAQGKERSSKYTSTRQQRDFSSGPK